MMEEWKDIKGYEGIYQVSSYGRVRSLDIVIKDGMPGGGDWFHKGRVLKPYNNGHGYMMVSLMNHGKRKPVTIHRLVAEYFIPNPNNYDVINHKDEDKNNNHVSNLEWCTQKYNLEYNGRAVRVGKTRSKAVGQYTKDGELVATYYGIREAHRQTGINNIRCAIYGLNRMKTAGGYVWKFL